MRTLTLELPDSIAINLADAGGLKNDEIIAPDPLAGTERYELGVV